MSFRPILNYIFYKSVICIETKEVFNSIKEAQLKYPSKHYARNIKNKWAICGVHFDYLTTTVTEGEQSIKVV